MTLFSILFHPEHEMHRTCLSTHLAFLLFAFFIRWWARKKVAAAAVNGIWLAMNLRNDSNINVNVNCKKCALLFFPPSKLNHFALCFLISLFIVGVLVRCFFLVPSLLSTKSMKISWNECKSNVFSCTILSAMLRLKRFVFTSTLFA